MDLIMSLVLGAAAGVLALFAVHRRVPSDIWNWAGALLVGLVGGAVGNFVLSVLGLRLANWFGALVVGFAGAVLVLMALRRILPTHDPKQSD